MSNYEFVDRDGDSLQIDPPYTEGGRVVLSVVNKIDETCNMVVIEPDDGPKIAWELMKVTGWTDESIVAPLKAYVEGREADEKAATLQARRDKVLQELTDAPFLVYNVIRNDELRKAIDRIVELEDKLSGD